MTMPPGYTSIASHGVYDEPYTCNECGAVTVEATAYLHLHWHDTLTEDYRNNPEDY